MKDKHKREIWALPYLTRLVLAKRSGKLRLRTSGSEAAKLEALKEKKSILKVRNGRKAGGVSF